MNILVTNDDGLYAPGIQVLYRYLRERHNVKIVAPDRDRSGVSHGVSIARNLKIAERGVDCYECSGLPADCVYFGINSLFSGKPDLVISGINKGANLGTDVIYSGTAAGARESVLLGVPGVAVSLADINGPWFFEPLAEFVSNNTENFVSMAVPLTFMNVNAMSLPERSGERKYPGVRFSYLSSRKYSDGVNIVESDDGTKNYTLYTGGIIQEEPPEESDWDIVLKGFISISFVGAYPKEVCHKNIESRGFII